MYKSCRAEAGAGRQQSLAPMQGLNQRHPAQAMVRLSPCTARSVYSWGLPLLRAEIVFIGLQTVSWH